MKLGQCKTDELQSQMHATLETLNFTIRIGSTYPQPFYISILYFDFGSYVQYCLSRKLQRVSICLWNFTDWFLVIACILNVHIAASYTKHIVSVNFAVCIFFLTLSSKLSDRMSWCFSNLRCLNFEMEKSCDWLPYKVIWVHQAYLII